MKRLITFLLMTAIVLSFSACSQSEAAANVDSMIAAIGEVTLDSEVQIADAENALNALEDADRKQVKGEETLTAARASYETLVAEAAAGEIEAAIDTIGEVTLESGEAIEAAAALYDGSDDTVKALVTNADVLDAARTKYDGLLVQKTIDAINAIGEVTLDSGQAIEDAELALEGMSESCVGKVTNKNVLETAREQYNKLLQEQAQSLLANMRLVEDQVRGLKFYHPKAFPWYDGTWCYDERTFVLPYLGMQDDDVWLRMILDYVEDDWIFYDHVIFALDDERSTKYFTYRDIVHETSYGDVCEYIDIEVGESELELLENIAGAAQAVIRFEGDNYYYDLTVSEQDKQAIRDVLTVYEALS